MCRESDRVYGEIAAGKVFFDCFYERDFRGVAFVVIAGFGAVGGDFDHIFFAIFFSCGHEGRYFYADSAESVFIEALRKKALDFFRNGIGSDVPVFWFAPEKNIANASAHDKGLESRLFESGEYFEDRRR